METSHIWIDTEEQVIQCLACGRLELPALPLPMAKFQRILDAFIKKHQHHELSPVERAQAAVIWRAEPDAG